MESKRNKQFSDIEIIQFLNQAAGKDEATVDQFLSELCEENGFSKDDFYKWRERYGNKFSVNVRSRRPTFSEAYIRIDKLANELSLPLEAILYFASQGLISIFTFFRQRDAIFLFVHRDFIAPLGLELHESLTLLPNLSSVGVSQLCSQDITGFFLNAKDCSELLKEGRVKQGLFSAALRCRFDRYSMEPPGPGYFPLDRYPDIDPKGWGVACYPKETALVFDPEKGLPLPIILSIDPTSLYVLNEGIETFLSIIDTETFLDDLLVPPVKSPLSNDETFHVVDNKPLYISAKLTHLIETSERLWRNKPSDDSGDYSSQQAKVRQALKDPNFLSSFKMTKGKVSEDMLAAASRFIEPLYARSISNEGKLSGHAYLSPELLIFLAAAKLFWSLSHVDFDDPATHPKNEEVKAYLGIRGITGNDANYAMTLIRPEQARYGGHKSYIRLLDRHNPLLRKPHIPPCLNNS